MKKRATIKDVAKLSGTSITTVSRVLNKSVHPVRKKLKKKVIEAARELNYKPNIYGQMLKSKISHEIGIIVPNISNPYYSQLISVIENEIISANYTSIIFSSFNDVEMEKRHIDTLIQRQVAGVMISSIGEVDSIIENLDNEKIRFVLFDQDYKDLYCDSVSFDFHKSSYMAVEFLINNGFKDIAFLTPPFDRKSRRMLYKGYIDALEDNGIKPKKELTIQSSESKTDNDEYKNGNYLAKLLLKQKQLPEAVVAINDITAIGIINELESKGINIPEDLSIISFDDITFAKMFTPALTTMRQPFYETGISTAQKLLKKIEGKEPDNNKIIIEPELIIRDTVKIKKKGDKMLEKSFDKLKVKKFETREKMGQGAAQDAADILINLLAKQEEVNVVFASAPSQDDFLNHLIEYKEIDWSRINAFQMDEYIGLTIDDDNSFSTYLRQSILDKVKTKENYFMNGMEDPEKECKRYQKLLEAHPIDVVFMGIGENGHIAFNDPPVADFNDSKMIKIVELDEVSRVQQVNDERYDSIEEVPKRAITLTIPTVTSGKYSLCIVPTINKAEAVKATLMGEISEKTPASILRTVNNAKMYIDKEAASLL